MSEREEKTRFEKSKSEENSYKVKPVISSSQRECVEGVTNWLKSSRESSKTKMVGGPL